MSGIVLKFPSDVSRRAHARKPRTSKNGTPEERATAVPVASEQQPARTCQPGHAWKPNHKGNNPLRAPFTAVSRAVTLVGKVIYRRHGFDPNELCEGVRSMWVTALRDGASKARHMADECDKAIEHLTGGRPRSAKWSEEQGATAVQFLQGLRTCVVAEFQKGKEIDQIFDGLEESYRSAARALSKP